MKNINSRLEKYRKIFFSLIYSNDIYKIFEESIEEINLLKKFALNNQIEYQFKKSRKIEGIICFTKFIKIFIKGHKSKSHLNIYILELSNNNFLNLLKRFVLYILLFLKQIFSFEQLPIIIGNLNGEIYVKSKIIYKSQIEIKMIRIHLLKLIIKQIFKFLICISNYDLLIIKKIK